MGFGSKGHGQGGCGRGDSGRGRGCGSQNNKTNNQDKKKMEFQPFHEGKGKMTYKQVKKHVLNIIKTTYKNGSDIYDHIHDGVLETYRNKPVHKTIIV